MGSLIARSFGYPAVAMMVLVVACGSDSSGGDNPTPTCDGGSCPTSDASAGDAASGDSSTNDSATDACVGCDGPTSVCGDNSCDANEDCTTCVQDCGACPNSISDLSLLAPPTCLPKTEPPNNVPSGARYVAPNGADTPSAGSQAKPYKTISYAVTQATAGDAIAIRGGVYRERVTTVFKKLHFQAYPGEDVSIRGSDVVTGFAPNGSVWTVGGWTVEFCQNCVPAGGADTRPIAARLDQVFLDGKPLEQVATLGEVGKGQFAIDYAKDEIHLGDDPSGKTVEVSARSLAFSFQTAGGAGSSLKGVRIEHFSPAITGSSNGPAALIMNVDNFLLEGCVVSDNATRGGYISKTGGVVRNNFFYRNGQKGLNVNQGTNVQVLGNCLSENNTEEFVVEGASAEAAGLKAANTTGLLLDGNISENNRGNGLWVDVDCKDAKFARNVVRGNRTGIFFEISEGATIVSNLVYGNESSGIMSSSSKDVHIEYNTLHDNFYNLRIVNTDRGPTHVANNNFVFGNISSNPKDVHVYAVDFEFKKPPDTYLKGLDYNAYFGAGATGWSNWYSGGYKNHTSLADFKTATGLEADGIGLTKTPFVDANKRDFRLPLDSPLKAAGHAISANAASLTSQTTAGQRYNTGAIELGYKP